MDGKLDIKFLKTNCVINFDVIVAWRFQCMQVKSKSLGKPFLIFILDITYKYRTSSDKYPRRSFNLEGLRGGVFRG